MRELRSDTIVTRASLIRSLKNWDDQANWERFDRTYRRLIISFAVKRGLSEQEAQDVAQETLVAVAKDIQKFEYDPERSSFKNWLFTVTRHRIVDYCRGRPKESGQRNAEAGDTTRTSTVARMADPGGDALDSLWDEEWRRTVTEQATERLKSQVSTEHFQIFYLSVIKEQSSPKVAAALGVSVAKIYVVRHRLARVFKKTVAALIKEIG